MIQYYMTNERGRMISFDQSSPFRIIDIDGLSENKVKLTESDSSNRVGSNVSNVFVQSNNITIEGDMKESSENRRTMLDVLLPGILCRLFRRDSITHQELYVEGYLTSTPNISVKKRVYQPFQFVLKTPYPYWRDASKILMNFSELESLFRFPRAFSGSVSWKISSRNINQLSNIINKGSVPVGFIARFKATDTVRGPELLKVLTQEKMKFTTLSMQVGDELIVSTLDNQCYCRLIRNKTETNVFFNMDFEATFFQLDVGENPIRFDASYGKNNLEVSIEYATTYAGV